MISSGFTGCWAASFPICTHILRLAINPNNNVFIKYWHDEIIYDSPCCLVGHRCLLFPSVLPCFVWKRQAGRQASINRQKQADVKWKQWRECRWVHSWLKMSGDCVNSCYWGTGVAHFLKARFKGHELKWKVMVGICEFDSEGFSVAAETPASFWLFHVQLRTVCMVLVTSCIIVLGFFYISALHPA